jgi:hypothetical protein
MILICITLRLKIVEELLCAICYAYIFFGEISSKLFAYNKIGLFIELLEFLI